MTLEREPQSGDALASCLREILAASGPPVISARGFVQSRGALTEYEVHIGREEQSWSIAPLGSPPLVSHSRGVTTNSDGERPGRFDSPPWPAHLAFPHRLTMWGYRGSDYTPVRAEIINRRWIVLTSEHVADPAILATLTFDRHHQLITRLVRPTDTTELYLVQGDPLPPGDSAVELLTCRYEEAPRSQA